MLEEQPDPYHQHHVSPADDTLSLIEINRERHRRTALLEEEITRLSGHINAINYRFISLLRHFDRQQGWQVDGVKSFAHWLNWKCGIGTLAAREKVRVARALEDLPLIDEAFCKGEISYSKVRAMTRVATPANESLLLMIAEHGTAQHIEQTVRKYRRCRSDNDTAVATDDTPSFQHYQDEDGMVHVHIKLPADEAQLLINAVEHLARDTKQAEENVSAETPPDTSTDTNPDNPAENVSAETFSSARALAVARLAEHFIATGTDNSSAVPGADRYDVILHINANEAHRDHQIEGGPVCHLDHNRFLDPEVARQLTCDAKVTTVTEDDEGNVLNIGRRSRTISRAMRTALNIRDGGCRFPNCHQQTWTDAHHIHHWADGGETSLDNLITLCRHHHRLLHKGEYSIKKSGGAVTFYNTRMNPITRALYPQWNQDNPERIIAQIELEQAEFEIDAATAASMWQGEGIDYGDVVSGLFDVADGS